MNPTENDPVMTPVNETLDRLLVQILKLGVLACAVLIGAGVLLTLSSPKGHNVLLERNIQQLVHNQTVEGTPSVQANADFLHPRSFSRALIFWGLVLLVLLPLIRVVFSLAGFWLNADYFYVGVTIVVLLGLLAGFLSVR